MNEHPFACLNKFNAYEYDNSPKFVISNSCMMFFKLNYIIQVTFRYQKIIYKEININKLFLWFLIQMPCSVHLLTFCWINKVINLKFQALRTYLWSRRAFFILCTFSSCPPAIYLGDSCTFSSCPLISYLGILVVVWYKLSLVEDHQRNYLSIIKTNLEINKKI